MDLDYNSLLISVGFSAAGLAVAIVGGWLLVRTERFMLTWAVGLLLIVGNVATYSRHVQHPSPLFAGLSMVFLMLAFSTLYGAAVQFVRGVPPWRAILRAGVPSVAAVLIPMAFGFDGLGFLAENAGAAALFFAIAAEYWRGRDEAPIPILGVAALHVVVGTSFALCAILIAWNGQLVLASPPNNWAEDLSLVVCLVGMTGIGALSLALNQWRLATRHRQDALTDPLTGLLNRRALFEAYGSKALAPDTVIVVFDLDHFKSINDRHGHAVGDLVLQRFAQTLIAHRRQGDSAARLGGEEFALVLPATPQVMAVQIAELVRRRFEAQSFPAEGGAISCTVSAGLAAASEAGAGFEATLNAADRALYLAKSGGRNRIVPASRLRAG